MSKSLARITFAVAIVALGMLVSGRADAGASASAPSKYSTRTHTTSANQPTIARPKQVRVDEMSSAAKTSVPKR